MARKNAKNAADDEQVIAGFHAVESALRRRPQDLIRLRIDGARRDRRMRDLVDLAQTAGITVEKVSSRDLDGLAPGLRHQGVVASGRSRPQRTGSDLATLLDRLESAAFLLVLDQVQDPHNLGACLRTAECAGVDAVILPRDGAAPVNETVRRVAAGAAERIPVFYVTNLARTLAELKQRGIWVIGTSDRAERDLYRADLRGPLALVLGAEGRGIRRLTADNCDHIIAIPMVGTVSSLNVSVATGVVLFEAMRQRDRAG